jgi:mannosyltransferase
VITVALPWLVLPPAILLTASQFSPVYNLRYVIYCLPALALLGAAGLSGVTRLVMTAPLARAGGAATWVPAALIVALLTFGVLGPQRTVRLTSSRPDNLRKMAAIVAAREHLGDAVLYVPSRRRVFGLAYPVPFQRLRDVALAVPPASAGNLAGTEVPAATLRARFATVSRVWLISRRRLRFSSPPPGLEGAKITLLKQLRLVRRWRIGRNDLLSLYQRAGPGRSPPRAPARAAAGR